MPEIVLRPAEAADGGVIARVQLAAWRATYGRLNPAMVDGLDLDRTAAGRLLVEDVLEGLTEAGYAECVLWVARENPHARGFYQHLGFRPDGGEDVWRGLPVVRYRQLLVPD